MDAHDQHIDEQQQQEQQEQQEQQQPDEIYTIEEIAADNKNELDASMDAENKINEFFNSHGIHENIIGHLEEIINLNLLTFDDFNDDEVLGHLKDLDDTHVDLFDKYKATDFSSVESKKTEFIRMLTEHADNVQSLSTSADIKKTAGNHNTKPGPNEELLKEILERTGYSNEITAGQRKYGGPPPNWEGPAPGNGCEIYIGKLPKDVYEDTLIPLLETYGQIWDMRIMIEPTTGFTKGYAFVTYSDKDFAKKAADSMNGFEIRPGKKIKVNVSIANVRLFIGNIPKNKSKEEIKEEFSRHVEGVTDVIIYQPTEDTNDKLKNRGFCFIDFDSHKNASQSRRKLMQTRVFNREIAADWADQAEEPDEETMAKVKVLYVRNLSSEITDEDVKKKFEVYGAIEHVRKLKDFAFVHFIERESALKAIEELNGQLFGKHNMDITLARPLSDKKKQMQQKRDDTKRFTGFKSSGGTNQLFQPFNKNNKRAGAKNIGNLMQQNFNNPNQQNSSFNEFFAAMGNFMKGFGVNNPNPEQLAMQFASVAAANQQPKQFFNDKNNMMQSANNMNKRNNNMGVNNNKANNMNLMNQKNNKNPNTKNNNFNNKNRNPNLNNANNPKQQMQHMPRPPSFNNNANQAQISNFNANFGGPTNNNSYQQNGSKRKADNATNRNFNNPNTNANKKGRFIPNQNPNQFQGQYGAAAAAGNNANATNSNFQFSNNQPIMQQPLISFRNNGNSTNSAGNNSNNTNSTQWYQDDFTSSHF